MNIVIIEPYYTGSHKTWLDGLVKHSCHNFEILTLDGKFWKWRMHGGAVVLADEYVARSLQPDLILTTDMLDLSTFLALTRDVTCDIATAVYFHENQLTYPWAPSDRDIQKNRDHHYGFINYVSALAADVVFFNSRYHRDGFLNALRAFLKRFPDHRRMNNVDVIAGRSTVLPLALSLPDNNGIPSETKQHINDCPIILWNHRWEYDKNPEDFFNALYLLKQKKIPFRLAVLGESFGKSPAVFDEARMKLRDEIVQFGYVEDEREYWEWLYRADIVPVTSMQDFFGASIVEAVHCRCIPLLPIRLAYPEIFPPEQYRDYYYTDFDEFVSKLEEFVSGTYPRVAALSDIARKYDWTELIAQYDQQFEQLAVKSSRKKPESDND